MKNYILTASVKIDDNDISKSREWEKSKGLDYGSDIAHLVLDCMNDGANIIYEIIETEINEETK